MLFDLITNELRARNIVFKVTEKNIMCQCLFHADNNPSMCIFKNGSFKCYGCGAKGNVRELCEELNIEYDDRIFKLEKTGKIEVLPVKHTVKTYDKLLAAYSKNDLAFQYLNSRGISKKIYNLFDVHYCESSHSVAIPIRMSNGKIVSIYTRGIESNEKLKTTGTDSKRVLFGLYEVAQTFDRVQTVFVVEGEIDCMSVMQCRIPCVSTMGVIPTDEQVRILSKFKNILYLADADILTKGTRYAFELQVRTMFRKYSKLISIRYVDYKGCKDCNDILKLKGAAALRRYLLNLTAGLLNA